MLGKDVHPTSIRWVVGNILIRMSLQSTPKVSELKSGSLTQDANPFLDMRKSKGIKSQYFLLRVCELNVSIFINMYGVCDPIPALQLHYPLDKYRVSLSKYIHTCSTDNLLPRRKLRLCHCISIPCA